MWTKPLFRLRAALVDLRPLLGSWKLSAVLMVAACVFYVLLAVYSWSVPGHVVGNIAGLTLFRATWVLLLVNTLVCIWNRWRSSSLGTILFHGAFFLVALGLLLSQATREESSMRVAVGERFTGGPAFRVDSIRAEFWRQELLFTKLEADLDIGTTRINRPLWSGGSSFLRLSGFGFAPRYELAAPDGTVIESAFVKMNVFPPGLRDFLIAEQLPYRVYLEVYPDAELVDGEVVNRSQNLVRPIVVASIYRGHFPVASGPLRPGEALECEGLLFRVPEIRLWGEFARVRDDGVPVIFLGALAGLTGLVLKLLRRSA